MIKKVLSLGQCAADHYALARLVEDELGGELNAADTSADALARLRAGQYALVLVNRILDADGDSGLAFISRLKDDPALAHIPVMLVSNHTDAQQQATLRGALPGFGKAALAEKRTIERLTRVLA